MPLKKGTYLVGGSLNIQASGVVLRGEGKSEDGTIIRGTGTTARNLIVVGGTNGAVIVDGTETDIQDLYVPAGSRSFHVQNASGYQVGDSVIVRRIGNDRWIHEIGMDHIYMRPGTGERGSGPRSIWILTASLRPLTATGLRWMLQ